MAVAILAKRGYSVVASTGRAESHSEYLLSLGAVQVIGRLRHDSKRPLGKQLWAGTVDTVRFVHDIYCELSICFSGKLLIDWCHA
eukprot:SAG31_NODE_142_length_22669_cov_18.630040_16_plen_85_part_00